MKKCIYLFLMILSLFFFNSDVFAQTYRRGIVTSNSTVKSGPRSDSPNLLSDLDRSMYLYYPEAVEIVGESGSYYQIKFLYTGFLYVGYVPKSNMISLTYTIDDSYKQSLVASGFPIDYAERLAILHAIHPNWTFTPSYTGKVQGGMDFYTAVNGEASVVSRNVIQSDNTSLRSTADGAYKNGQWIPLAGNGWYGASAQTIAFYMDPRNFLDESHIFMFENLGYNPTTQTRTAVEKVLNGTFMANNKPFECLAGANGCTLGLHYYIDTFMTAGVDKKVSPIHLASRVIKEQGNNGSVLSLGKGYNGNYIGLYNFFNIGASGKVDSEVIVNGFNYAKNRNWNNQHISIYEGSNLIASNYISRGQSTGYYQKFNTITPSYYGNQYMQNVQAPYSEAYSTYTAYYKSYASREAWDNALYDFLIPIYQNMGSNTSLDASYNSDTTLRSLVIEECKMNPSFQSSAYNYDCYTKKETKEINIRAEATNPNARVTNPGKVTLNSDETSTSVVVRAVNGMTSTYTINVHRIETDGYSPTEILNGVGVKVNGEYASNIALGSDVSNLINSIVNKHHFASVQVSEANGTPITEGTAKTGQIVTITNAGITSTYRIIIYGDTNGDGLVDIRDLLFIQKHLVKSSILSSAYLMSADLNKDGLVDIRDLLLEQKYLVGAYAIDQG